jgi:pyruvate/2-oxoglutarate/acetoin dehydrogenase E1 component
MSRISYRQAIAQALAQEMRRDPTVILLGVDVAGGQGGTGAIGEVGGVLGVTRGLYAEFGSSRVIDTPISESAIIGAASGAAVTGMRPVAELMFVDFVGVCFDQIYNQAAKFRYMFGGKVKTPMVMRTMAGAGFRAGAQHSQTLAPLFTMVPGLKVVMPSNPYDAKGLLIQAIRDDDPVIFIESKVLYDTEGEVPEEAYRIAFGEANVVREGDDVTLVAFAAMVPRALAAAESLSKSGIAAEVIDPRTSSPLDLDTILESVEKTGRLVVIDESPPRCSLAADVAALVADQGFGFLKGPIRTVTCPHTPVPFAPVLEDAYVPTSTRIEEVVRALVGASRATKPTSGSRSLSPSH